MDKNYSRSHAMYTEGVSGYAQRYLALILKQPHTTRYFGS